MSSLIVTGVPDCQFISASLRLLSIWSPFGSSILQRFSKTRHTLFGSHDRNPAMCPPQLCAETGTTDVGCSGETIISCVCDDDNVFPVDGHDTPVAARPRRRRKFKRQVACGDLIACMICYAFRIPFVLLPDRLYATTTRQPRKRKRETSMSMMSMPWCIPVALMVLWGVFWRFRPFEFSLVDDSCESGIVPWAYRGVS